LARAASGNKATVALHPLKAALHLFLAQPRQAADEAVTITVALAVLVALAVAAVVKTPALVERASLAKASTVAATQAQAHLAAVVAAKAGSVVTLPLAATALLVMAVLVATAHYAQDQTSLMRVVAVVQVSQGALWVQEAQVVVAQVAIPA
jgi:hypothetical protein